MKILMLTTVYPRNDAPKTTTATKVIHYFTKEWKKVGHDVVVIHTVNRLPLLIYYLPNRLKKIIKAKTSFEVPDSQIVKEIEYEYEGISVYRRMVKKIVPRGLNSNRSIKKAAKSINDTLQNINFKPDLIIGHWASPCALLLAELKKYYTCKNAFIFHSEYYAEQNVEKMKMVLKKIDKVGCRSVTLANKVQKALELKETPFVCYSGIPDSYIEKIKDITSKHRNLPRKFLYVGELIERKHVDNILKALSLYIDKDWILDIVGIGNSEETLRNISRQLKISDRVIFHGRIPREHVFDLMLQAHVFTMISSEEAFGLVYLEAMAAGCITIGSKQEGIDGIIEDCQNGYLCSSGNTEELIMIYKKIFTLSQDNREKIAISASNTARQMTDSIVAKKYLDDIV